jgi:hypothetical protein
MPPRNLLMVSFSLPLLVVVQTYEIIPYTAENLSPASVMKFDYDSVFIELNNNKYLPSYLLSQN